MNKITLTTRVLPALNSTGIARAVAGAAVAAMVLILDLISFAQLIYAGPLAGSRPAGLSAMLTAFVIGSLICAVLRRGVPITLSFIGAAAIVQSAMAAAIAERLLSAGVDDPEILGQAVLLVCCVTTLATGVAFALLGTLRASLVAQLLPYPVITGFLGGVGLLFVRSGLQIGARLNDLSAALSTGLDASTLTRLGATVAIGAAIFALPRRLRHWAVFPAVVAGSLLVVHAWLAWAGLGVAEAQSTGWLIDPLPDGSLLRPPIVREFANFDPMLLVPLLPRIATEIVVAIIIQILYVLSVELEMRCDLDIDATFVATGVANLLGAAFGGIPLGFGRTPTMVLHNAGAGNWLGWSLVVAIMTGLLLFGPGSLTLLPRPLAGGALVGIGLGLVTLLVLAYRTISAWEIATAVAVCIATAVLGAAPGFLVGIGVAILIFAAQYGQIPAVRRAETGAQRPSSIIRAPDTASALREASRATLVYSLQGYLFFLNAQAVCRQAVAAEAGLRFLVLDFRDCVGLDSSALVAFRKIGQVAEQRGFDVLLVNLAPATLRQVSRGGLKSHGRVQVLNTLDEALRHAEATLLAESGITAGPEGASFALHLARSLGCAFAPDDFTPYLTPQALEPGVALLRQGEEADSMYFIESGLVSIELEIAGRSNVRLRTTAAGTVIGEIALVQGGPRTATAVAESACRVVGLGREALARMERERPDLALRLQRFLILELASKVADTNRLLEAELR